MSLWLLTVLFANVWIIYCAYFVLLELVLISLAWTFLIYHLLHFVPFIDLIVVYFSKTLGL